MAARQMTFQARKSLTTDCKAAPLEESGRQRESMSGQRIDDGKDMAAIGSHHSCENAAQAVRERAHERIRQGYPHNEQEDCELGVVWAAAIILLLPQMQVASWDGKPLPLRPSLLHACDQTRGLHFG
mmetsp:Transcript_42700/g.91589  ORF Transcript_42700/g.91589 Transcript_42700/m.91589 type:complete len:127 (-) Transcript_42700:1266-1646(-)